MEKPLPPSFFEQQRRYALRCTCEDCTYFEVSRERCTHGYPNEAHREARLARESGLIFCKEFELK